MANFGFIPHSDAITGLAQGEAFYALATHSSKSKAVTRNLPIDIAQKINKTIYSIGNKRVKSALYSHNVVRKIFLNDLDKRSLAVIARRLNKKTTLPSFNCALLSRSFLYNMINEKEILTVGNPLLPFLPVFETELKSVLSVTTLKAKIPTAKMLEEQVLICHEQTRERVFEISYLKKLPMSDHSTGHNFNAVVLFHKDKTPYVQFVDAWAKSNPTPTTEQIAKKYSKGTFYISKANNN